MYLALPSHRPAACGVSPRGLVEGLLKRISIVVGCSQGCEQEFLMGELKHEVCNIPLLVRLDVFTYLDESSQNFLIRARGKRINAVVSLCHFFRARHHLLSRNVSSAVPFALKKSRHRYIVFTPENSHPHNILKHPGEPIQTCYVRLILGQVSIGCKSRCVHFEWI